MFSANLTRDQFIGWLGGTYEPNAKRITSLSNLCDGMINGGISLIWDKKPGTKIDHYPIICVEDHMVREFFAFASTYVSTYTPFTAFFRVLSTSELSQIVLVLEDGVRLGAMIPRSLVSVVIAEAYAQIGSRTRSIADISIQASLATLSSAALSAMAKGYSLSQIILVMRNWTKARRLVSDDALRLPSGAVEEFWSTISQAYVGLPSNSTENEPRAKRIASFITAVRESNTHTVRDQWYELTIDLPDLRSLPERMQGTREDRVRLFDNASKILGASVHVDRQIREVAAGYLGALVAGGSLNYFSLLQPYNEALPGTILWFGLFASLHPDTDVLTAGDCLGRRIVRHVFAPFYLFDAPIADVSLDELDVLTDDRRKEPKFRTEHQSSVAVEVYPGVSASYRLLRGSKVEVDRNDRIAEVEQFRELRYLIDRFSSAIDRMDPPSQRDLFNDRSVKYRGNKRYKDVD